MYVLMLNGSPREKGCTYTALAEMADELKKCGAEAEILHIGTDPVQGCIACGECDKLDMCVFDGDVVSRFVEQAKKADGFVFGSPVYYANPNGSMLAAMDRIFYSSGKWLSGKPAVAVASARRAGTTSALDAMQKFFPINGMPLVPAKYWPMVFGNRPEETRLDEEGLQNMRAIARNMVWMIQSARAADSADVLRPIQEQKIYTNFFRKG
jgi:multimeric flavodoxin WrbA